MGGRQFARTGRDEIQRIARDIVLAWQTSRVDRAMLAGADVRDLLAAVRVWRRPDFPIGGDDALAAGLQGQEIGQALSRVAKAWVESDFDLDREALLELLRARSE